MRFLPDERLYWDAGRCLRFLRELETPDHGGVAGERFHAYWQGPFTAKQAFSVKSILATQTDAEVWLWLDADDGYAAHESNPLLRSLPPEVSIRPLDAAVESRGTPLEGRSELYGDVDSGERADQPYANNAFLRLRQGSETAQELLARSAEVG